MYLSLPHWLLSGTWHRGNILVHKPLGRKIVDGDIIASPDISSFTLALGVIPGRVERTLSEVRFASNSHIAVSGSVLDSMKTATVASALIKQAITKVKAYPPDLPNKRLQYHSSGSCQHGTGQAPEPPPSGIYLRRFRFCHIFQCAPHSNKNVASVGSSPMFSEKINVSPGTRLF